MTDTVFTDARRMRELLDRAVLDGMLAIQQSGHSFALRRAAAYTRHEAAFLEETSGIAFYQALRALDGESDATILSYGKQLEALSKKVFGKARLLVHMTCDAGQEEALHPILDRELIRMPAGMPCGERFVCPALGKKNEALVTQGQVQFVALSGDGGADARKNLGTLQLLRHYLSIGYLWQQIRVLGGAYGCGALFHKSGEAAFFSYRDPHLKETLQVYRALPEMLKAFQASSKEMTKLIIGTISGLEMPLTPYAFGQASLSTYLTGSTKQKRQRARDQIFNTKAADIRRLAPILARAIEENCICAVTSAAAYARDKDCFDTEIRIR